jgi:hypothetical protein
MKDVLQDLWIAISVTGLAVILSGAFQLMDG